MRQAILSLGANLGDRPNNLRLAIEAIGQLPGTSVAQISSFYETKPFGVIDDQPLYLNGCVMLDTALSPHALLGACLGIEAAMGRRREGIKAARVIDIDLLLYEGVRRMETPELMLPHPRMLERAFVLVPLYELYPGGRALGLSFHDELKRVDQSGVVRWSEDNENS